jgi:hypothetical protein
MAEEKLEQLFKAARTIDLGECGTVNMRYLPAKRIPDLVKALLVAFKSLAKVDDMSEENTANIFGQFEEIMAGSADVFIDLVQECIDRDLNDLPGMTVLPLLINEFVDMNLGADTLKNWQPLLQRFGVSTAGKGV